MTKRSKRELDEILSCYTDILIEKGAESHEEYEFLMKYAGEEEVMALLHSVRAVKALFETYGDFPAPKEHESAPASRIPERTTP